MERSACAGESPVGGAAYPFDAATYHDQYDSEKTVFSLH